jgi:hypothetical protein
MTAQAEAHRFDTDDDRACLAVVCRILADDPHL